MGFSEFLENYSNFKTYIATCNTKHITSIFKHENNLIFFLYTFLEKKYRDEYFLVKFVKLP